MDFDINNSLPIWKQITDQLRERIAVGEFRAGASFPTVRDLAAQAGVNPNTMQRAMVQLETEGLVITNRTAGRVVTDDINVIEATRTGLADKRIKDFLKDMKGLGYEEKDVLKMIKEGK